MRTARGPREEAHPRAVRLRSPLGRGKGGEAEEGSPGSTCHWPDPAGGPGRGVIVDGDPRRPFWFVQRSQ